MASHLSIEDQLAALVRQAYPNADFSHGGRLDTLRQLLMNELASPNIVPNSVMKAARGALGAPHKKAGAGLLNSRIRESIRGERVKPGWRERWPELAKFSEAEYIANAAERWRIP